MAPAAEDADLFAAVEGVLPWNELAASVAEAEQLAQPGEFDSLAFMTNSYPVLRRYVPLFMETFEFRPAPGAEELVRAVELLRELNKTGARKLPDDAPCRFIRPRWGRYVFTSEGLDRRFYETCVLSELGKSLRAGDLSVTGSRRYRDFDDYLLPAETFSAMRTAGLPLAIEIDAEKYLAQRIEHLHAEFQRVDRLARTNELPEASVTKGVLKITPLDNQESEEAELLTRQAYGLLPRIKITDLLTEVDSWCDFGRHFTNLRSGEAVSERGMLLTAILADGINLGLTRMADACPGVSLSTLSRIATWHIRDETYAKALAEIVNHQHQLEFAGHWGDGTTSSSGSDSRPEAVEKALAPSMPATEMSRVRRSTLTSLINTLHSTANSSAPPCETPPMSLMGCSIMRPLFVSKSITPTPADSPTTSSPCAICSASGLPRAFATLATRGSIPWENRPAIRRLPRSSAAS